MIEIGKWQTLKVVRSKEFGIYLAENQGDDDAVLLPRKYVPDGLKAGGSIEVFVYLDSEDRPIATTRKPLITLGEIKRLRCAGVSKIGAFMGRPRVGISFYEVSESVAKLYDMPAGLHIAEISPDCDIANTPLAVDDVIVEMNGVPVRSADDVYKIILKLHPGDEVTAKVIRPLENGKTKEFEITFKLMEDTSSSIQEEEDIEVPEPEPEPPEEDPVPEEDPEPDIEADPETDPETETET